jgi:hypothetical protein
MRVIWVLLLLLSCSWAIGQRRLTGTVIDAEKGLPLPGVSIFLSSTSVGTITDERGRFVLWMPDGTFELVATSVGYATYQQVVSGGTDSLQIRMFPKTSTLETIVVEAFEKDGWKKWGRWFLEQFIGMSAYAEECRLLNPEVLRFRLSEKGKLLTVIAKEPLVVENKALGYRVRYQLEEFWFDFDTKLLFYAGFPFFEPMKGSEKRQQQWAAKRKEVYTGSVLHFMRALHAGRFQEEGFEVRTLEKKPNLEKERVRKLYRTMFSESDMVVNMAGDSSAYYTRVLKQPNLLSTIGKELLSREQLGAMSDSSVYNLRFQDFLHVWFKPLGAPVEYQQSFPESAGRRISELQLVDAPAVEVWANGYFAAASNLIFNGFWGWWEKMATMLPLDYEWVDK